jgi:alkanesulfonate monooxygenase SsuD/methylene tetrahydromethanopterin reductase-like flavin-dependent oxidoreductase (luciferase family)
MKVGVELHPAVGPAELVADARAFEAAGVDSLWVRGSAPFDPWVVLGALAAATWRVRLVAFAAEDRPLVRETLEDLSRGRLVVASGRGDSLVIATADGDEERWSYVDFPPGRAAWKDLRAKHESEGKTGLVLRNDPRLLDLLRNPDTEEDRPDVRQAFG